MRFRENMQGVTPLLSAIAPESTLERPDGPHSGNPHVRASVANGEPQHLAWCVERPDGGRGFGFTGGHYHSKWGDDQMRKLILNAIAWTAKLEIPEGRYLDTNTDGSGIGRVSIGAASFYGCGFQPHLLAQETEHGSRDTRLSV